MIRKFVEHTHLPELENLPIPLNSHFDALFHIVRFFVIFQALVKIVFPVDIEIDGRKEQLRFHTLLEFDGAIHDGSGRKVIVKEDE